ncbi:MAG: PQQ-binding-like beta-propeller repeat protein [Verrucomicrobiota bacterium]
MNPTIAATAAAILLISSISRADNWSNWRGPAQNGTAEATDLPTKFSKTEGIKWSVDMPGASSATPAIWGDDVFVSSTDEEKEELIALCLDRKTGEEKWRKPLGKGLFQDNRSNYSGPSPTTDGEAVIFFYGTGDMAALSLEGGVLWQKNIQEDYDPFYFLWTFSTSPLLHNGSVILQVLQRDTPVHKFQKGGKDHDSFLIAFDAKTGKEQWKVKRNSEAVAEAKEAFSTPVIHTLRDGKEIMLVSGGDIFTAHDPASGKELWRWGTYNEDRIGHWRLVPSPVAGAGVALICAPKKAPVYAVEAETGNLIWVSEDPAVSSDVPTPAFLDGKFYILSDVQKSLSCVDARTGEIHWTSELETRSKFEASPTIADGKIYMINHAGEVFVALGW